MLMTPLSLLLLLSALPVDTSSLVPLSKSKTNLHSGNEFNDSIVDDDNKEIADILDGVIGDIGKVVDVLSFSTASAISSVLDQNDLRIVGPSLPLIAVRTENDGMMGVAVLQ